MHRNRKVDEIQLSSWYKHEQSNCNLLMLFFIVVWSYLYSSVMLLKKICNKVWY